MTRPAEALSIQASEVVRLIGSARLPLSDEKAAQAALSLALDAAGMAHVREMRLSPKDIVDFLIPETGLAIEVKIAGTRKAAAYRQLERYAAYDEVRAIVLATSVSMGLPPEIGGKPAYYASLGRGWI